MKIFTKKHFYTLPSLSLFDNVGAAGYGLLPVATGWIQPTGRLTSPYTPLLLFIALLQIEITLTSRRMGRGYAYVTHKNTVG